MPSMVVSSAPSAWTVSKVQLLTGLPFIWMTQAPHWLVSQPMCVPVRPRLSRKKLTSSSRGSTSAAYSTPLTFSLTATRLGAAIVVAIVSALLRLLAAVHHGHGGTESVAFSRRLAVTPFRAGERRSPAPSVRWQRHGRPPDGVSHPTWDWHVTWARVYRRFRRLSSRLARNRVPLGGRDDDFRRCASSPRRPTGARTAGRRTPGTEGRARGSATTSRSARHTSRWCRSAFDSHPGTGAIRVGL